MSYSIWDCWYKRILQAFVFGFMTQCCCSCFHSRVTHGKATLIEVWTEKGWPKNDASAPDGFKVTPLAAYEIVAKSGKLSLKHPWICFRDDEYYYIADVFGKQDNSQTARKYGIKVNGVSGDLK